MEWNEIYKIKIKCEEKKSWLKKNYYYIVYAKIERNLKDKKKNCIKVYVTIMAKMFQKTQRVRIKYKTKFIETLRQQQHYNHQEEQQHINIEESIKC